MEKEQEVELVVSPEEIPALNESNMVEENTAPEPPCPEHEAQTEQEEVDDELKYGYLVGINATGNLVFKPIGTSPGLVELLGMHAYAKHRLDQYIQQGDGGGLTVINERIGKLTQAVQFLVQLFVQNSSQK